MTIYNRFRLWLLQREVAHWEQNHRHLLRKRRWLRDAIAHTRGELGAAQLRLRRTERRTLATHTEETQ